MKRKIIALAIALVATFTASTWADTSSPNTATPNAPVLALAAQSKTAPTATAVTTMSPEQVKDIQQIVHDYLVQNPEVLIEASQALQMKEAAKAEASAQQSIVQYKTQIFNDPASPVLGNSNGNVILAEFFDYQCIHCKAMNNTIQSLIKKNSNLKVIFKELPIFGGNSQFASQAALAAAKQNKYAEMHDALLAADNPITQDKVWAVAKQVGLNIDQLKKDMSSPEIQKQIQDNFKLAQSLKLIGTPTFVMSDKTLSQFKFIPGQTTQDDLQQKVNTLMGQGQTQATTPVTSSNTTTTT